MSVTQKNVIAGHRGTGNQRFAKCTGRNVCAELSLPRMGKTLRTAYLNAFQLKIKSNDRNSNEDQVPNLNLALCGWGHEEDRGLLFPCHAPALDLSRVAAACSASPPLRGLFAATALEQPSSRCLKKCRMTFK